MKSIIICEGRTDFLFLQYFMRNVNLWEDAGKTYRYNAFFLGNRGFYKNHDEVVIGFSGGSTKIPYAVEQIMKINRNSVYPDEKYDNLVVVTDRDDEFAEQFIIDSVDRIISAYSLQPVFSQNDTWENITFHDTLGQKFHMNFLCLVIPPEENGAIETLLLDSIAINDEYDAMLIRRGNDFVDTVDFEEKYLKKRRYITKAKLNVYLSIRVPEFDFGRLHEIYKTFPWEKHGHIKEALSNLKALESDN